jgi:hypothetical protein
MDNYKNELVSLISKIDRRHIQLAIVIIALSLFILSAGAPMAFGDFASLPVK